MNKIEIPENMEKCPFRGTRIGGAIGTAPQIDDWWPNRCLMW